MCTMKLHLRASHACVCVSQYWLCGLIIQLGYIFIVNSHLNLEYFQFFKAQLISVLPQTAKIKVGRYNFLSCTRDHEPDKNTHTAIMMSFLVSQFVTVEHLVLVRSKQKL